MKATSVAGSNIAFVKYWGNRDDSLNLPMNSSLSLTLAELQTKTTVEFSAKLDKDEIQIDGRKANPAAHARAVAHLDRLRKMAGVNHRARAESRNNFPAGAGLASSASAFAALTVATAAALSLRLGEKELSMLARLGSGSAARSILGGYVEWLAGERNEDSYAQQVAPPEHWGLVNLIAIVSTAHKEYSSQDGHRLAATSPLYPARLAALPQALEHMKQAILIRNFSNLGPLLEAEALSLHAIMLTSTPSLIYWAPATLEVMQTVKALRKRGLLAYFTLDAGPNVHIITLPQYSADLQKALESTIGVQKVLVARPGEGARLSLEHLF